MKKGDKNRQKKALAKRTERKVERAVRHAQQSGDIAVVRHAREYPLLGCWIQPGWKENGISPVVVARRQVDGRVVFGTYLVDFYCLGVKNCFARGNIPYAEFMDEALPKLMQGPKHQVLAPDLAHEMIYGSIEYAARWGFRPDPDFDLAQMVLDPAEMHPGQNRVTFGKDGKPFYVSGPRDDPRAIVDQLQRTAGAGNYDYLVHLGEPPDDMFEIDEGEEEDEEP